MCRMDIHRHRRAEAGTLFEGDRRFDILVRLPDALRSDLESFWRLPIALPRATGARR